MRLGLGLGLGLGKARYVFVILKIPSNAGHNVSCNFIDAVDNNFNSRRGCGY